MRFRSRRTSLALVAAFLLGAIASQLASPLYREVVMFVSQERFGKLVFACDNAMRDHLLAKQRLDRAPSADAVDLVRVAEVGLLDCQSYDMFRKRLKQFGLTDGDLSLMTLNAIEDHENTFSSVVTVHEINR